MILAAGLAPASVKFDVITRCHRNRLVRVEIRNRTPSFSDLRRCVLTCRDCSVTSNLTLVGLGSADSMRCKPIGSASQPIGSLRPATQTSSGNDESKNWNGFRAGCSVIHRRLCLR
jgi:hypothetical protein